MTVEQRIEQFQKMVQSDPNNELGHFSLGSALMEAKRFAEAGPCFQRVLALNPNYSKAYLMLAKAQVETGHKDFAVQTLNNGFMVAHRRGDLMPRNEMGEMLQQLGAPVPATDKKEAAGGAAGPSADGWACIRCGGGGPKLKERPFKGPLGERILASVCSTCWNEWIRMGTKVINELRLPMFDPQAQEMYDKHMKEFLGIRD